MWEKGCDTDWEEGGGLGPEESRRDERSDYWKEVKGCWEDITLDQRRFVAPSSVVGNAAKYAEGTGVAGEEEDIDLDVLLLPGVDWIVDSSAARSCAGFFW